METFRAKVGARFECFVAAAGESTMGDPMIEATTLWQLVERRAEKTPMGVFAIDEAERRLTFESLRDEGVRVAAGLFEQGLRDGDPVSWVLPTRLSAFVLMVALARLGAVQNPLVPIYRRREVEFCLQQTGARWILTPGVVRGFDFGELARELAAESDSLQAIDISGGLPAGDPSLLPDFEDSSGESTKWVFYTSGTTSDPKGARHSDDAVLVSSRGLVRALGLGPDSKTGVVFPVTHLGGANALVSTLFAGSTQLVVEQFDPPSTVAFLARHGVTHAGAGAVFYQAYLDVQRASGPEPIFPELRALYGGGAPTPAGLHAEVREELGGLGILSTYGMTECPIITMTCWDDPPEKRSTTEGRVTDPRTRIRIVDSEGHEVPVGEQGEVLINAPQLTRGYVDERLNAEAFDDDGFFRTGDIGRLDESDYLCLTGRLKDVIIRKGENISAPEIEAALFEHAKVVEVAVIGLPDRDRGELVCAIVRPADSKDPLEFDEMVEHLTACGLMRQKIPERLEQIDEMPRNPSGKIVKPRLKALYSSSTVPDT
jgi:acyl-CoA synthetase (AMP-forming)/AMP-acid ligase II